MKRLAIILAAALAALPAVAQEYDAPSYAEELVFDVNDLLPEEVEVKGASQGFAMWGRYAFSLHDKGQCVVIDMKRRRFAGSFRLEGNDTHCNNASFGVERYSRRSKFPLLYISECKGSHACYVTDIGLDGSRIVQKIYYDGDDYTGSFDWCVDRRNRLIYTYGTAGKAKRIKKFRLPRLADSDADGTVRLTAADALDTFDVEGIKIYQGSCIKGRYIYLPDGYPPHDRLLHVVDLATGRKVDCIDLNHLKHEPEGLDIKGRWLYLSFHVSKQPRHNTVYRFSLK